MEANPHAINLGGDDEYTVTKPLKRPPPPPAGAGRQIVPMDSTSSLVAENPHAISLNNNDYPTSYGGSSNSTADEYGQTSLPPRDITKEGKVTKKVFTAKLFMCAFVIGFLWLTTFGAARGFVNAVIKNDVTPAQVLYGWNNTMHQAAQVKDNFDSCIESKNAVCLSELNISTLEELQRGIDIETGSEVTIAKAQTKLAACQAKVQQKHQAIKIWMDELAAVGKQWLTTAQCKNNALYAEFLKLGDGNSTANADAQARALTQQYQSALGQMADSTRDAFAVRVAYNQQWASNHTPSLLQNLSLTATKIAIPNLTLSAAFASLSAADLSSLTDIQKTLGPEMNETWNNLVIKYAATKNLAEQMQNSTLAYKAKYDAAVQNMTNYVTATQNWLKDAKATVQKFGGTSAVNILPRIDVSAPSFPPITSFDALSMPGFNLSTAQWNSNLANKLAAYKTTAQAKADAANAQMKAYFANLDTKPDWFSCFACDYNPPPLLFPTEDEQAQSDADFSNQLNGLLTNLGDAADSAQVGAPKSNSTAPELPSLEFIQAQRSKENLQFAEMAGDVDFTNILAAFATISSLFLSIDYVYRVFRSVVVFVRYWFGSAVGLPDVEINKQESAKVQQPCGVRLMNFLTDPYFVLTLVGLIIFGLVYVILNLYVPILNEYSNGCASPAKENGPGTLISNNAYSLVYNGAVGPGQKTMQKYLTDYDALRQNICGQYVSQTGTTQQQLQSILNAALQAYQKAYADLQLMNQCMDQTTNNFNFDTQTNGTLNSGVNFNNAIGIEIPFTMTQGPQRNRWNESAISCTENELAIYSDINDMTFVCGNVSLCTHMPECVDAIDSPALKHATWKSSCDSEKIVLIGMSAAGFSVLVYIVWNVGRVLVVMGIGRLLWRHLVPHGFNYVATCTTDGRIPRDTEKEVTAKLAKIISRFERWGIIYLFLGVFLQLLWIIPVAVFANEIASISP